MSRSLLSGLLRPAGFGPEDDPGAAPWVLPGSPTDLPYRWHRVRPNLVMTYAAGVVFLVFAIPTIADGIGPVQLALRLCYLVVLAVAYVGAAWTADATLPQRWGYVGAFTALVCGGALLWGWEFANFGVYPAVLLATLIPWHQARLALIGWALALSLAGLFGRLWTPVLISALSLGIGLGIAGWLENSRIRTMLERSETRIEVLTVEAERARISRDLHDILGHSLTAITITSSLAARLVDRDPTAAKDEMAAVEAIARQALTDVRATVSGLAQVRLATELATARSVLTAAGIEARTPAAVPTLTDGLSELFGFVIREAVTNVVRHAEASWCAIAVDDRSVTVVDNGVGIDPRRRGRGLTGLGERVAAAGGAVEFGSPAGGGTSIRVILSPASQPGGRRP